MALREPFHEGEIAVQERTGERAQAVRLGASLKGEIMRPALEFVAGQRTVALGAVDESGRPWCSLWLGAPGFMTSEDGRTLHIAHGGHAFAREDALRPILAPGRDIGLLVIDLATRRRLRVNGVVARVDGDRLEVTVREAFPNCPKYIQRRDPSAELRESSSQASQRGQELDVERRAFVERVDTLFVASCHPTRGVDASHRGGARGFVRVVDERRLRFPDYQGNGMYQTLGNFEIVPRAGVVMVDFERGRFLSLTGAVSVAYGAEGPDHPTGGTGRYWELAVEEWLEFDMPGGFQFRFVQSSPFNVT